jgi:hypothetical protein
VSLILKTVRGLQTDRFAVGLQTKFFTTWASNLPWQINTLDFFLLLQSYLGY